MLERRRTHWTQYITIITPFLLFILAMLNASANQRLQRIETYADKTYDMVYKHQTNDELHPAKSFLVTKAEYTIYQEMSQRQMESLKEGLNSRIDNLRMSMDKVIDLLNKRK